MEMAETHDRACRDGWFMISKLIAEVLAYFFFAIAVLVLWFVFPVVVLRMAMVVAYMVFIRWAWKRGS
jgi:hypothetical protein